MQINTLTHYQADLIKITRGFLLLSIRSHLKKSLDISIFEKMKKKKLSTNF